MVVCYFTITLSFHCYVWWCPTLLRGKTEVWQIFKKALFSMPCPIHSAPGHRCATTLADDAPFSKTISWILVENILRPHSVRRMPIALENNHHDDWFWSGALALWILPRHLNKSLPVNSEESVQKTKCLSVSCCTWWPMMIRINQDTQILKPFQTIESETYQSHTVLIFFMFICLFLHHLVLILLLASFCFCSFK